MQIDDDSLELVERRLSERVEGQVRDRLFRFYRVAWAVAFAVLGFFGYNVVAGLNERADRFAQDAVQPAVDNANAAAARAERQLDELLARMDAAEEFQRRREQLLIDSEHRLAQDQARIDAISRQTDERLDGITRKLDEAEAQLTALGERIGKEVAGIGSVDALASDIERVAERVEEIGRQAGQLGARTAAGETAPEWDYEPLELSTAALPAAPPERATVAASGTVYLQFTGVSRDVAQELAAALADLGYTMPGEERTEAAEDRQEVRYFFEGDAERAARLVDNVNRILEENGYRADVSLADFTGYYGGKPREGTLELWLEPAPAG